MKISLNSLVKRPDLPNWFTTINYIALLPIIFWPIAAFGGIFLFDNPKNLEQTYLLFFAIIIYPIILFLNMLLSFWLFKYQKQMAVILPSIVIITFAYIALNFYMA